MIERENKRSPFRASIPVYLQQIKNISCRYNSYGDFTVVTGSFSGWMGDIFVDHPNFFERILGITLQAKIDKAKSKMQRILEKKERLYQKFEEVEKDNGS